MVTVFMGQICCRMALPTEAEWEYCAQAGTDSVYSGGDVLKEVGWLKKNNPHPSRRPKRSQMPMDCMT